MSWDNEAVLEFIELLKCEPAIWDPKNKFYKNRTVLNDGWARIKNLFSLLCSIEELKKKRNSLMTSYREHLRKIKETTTSGSSTKDIYKPTWFAFEPMNSFLAAVYECQNTMNTEKQTDSIVESPLSRDSDGLSVSDSIQSNDASEGSNKRRRCTQDLLLAKEQMDEAFSLVKDTSKMNMKAADENDLYGQLLAQKLKQMPEDDRLILMHEIDNLVFKYSMKIRSRLTNPTTIKNAITPETNMPVIHQPPPSPPLQYCSSASTSKISL